MWYYTPFKLTKMYRGTGRCWRCRSANAGFKHFGWNCVCAKRFGVMIREQVQLIITVKMIKDTDRLEDVQRRVTTNITGLENNP